MRLTTCSLADARRIALHAQGLAEPRRTASSRKALLRTVARLGVLQIDAVNVLERAHYVPLFSRHGPYDRADLDDAAYGAKRALFEYWGHQASLLPTAMHPLFRWRMNQAERLEGIYSGIAKFVRARRPYVDDVLREITERGPLRAGELTQSAPRSGGWWGWSDAKRALEWLFWAGLVTTSARRSFERIYDLTERVIPPDVLSLPRPSPEDAHRELVRLSARALGIATEDDLADYFRLRTREARPRIDELVEEGHLRPLRVEGISKVLYVAKGAEDTPAQATGAALLSPFDPLIWYRARSERLFDFHYRIEIYTPAHLRKHGYYVLPFLLGDRVAARVDLKADRPGRRLLVHAAHLEPPASAPQVSAALAAELRTVAEWLSLDSITVTRRGTLAKALSSELRRSGR